MSRRSEALERLRLLGVDKGQIKANLDFALSVDAVVIYQNHVNTPIGDLLWESILEWRK